MKKYNVFGIGHPLIDIKANVDDDFIKKYKLSKGLCNLTDDNEKIDLILSELKSRKTKYGISSGDSTANTLSAVTNFGGKAIFYGCIGNDDFGKIFLDDLEKEKITTKLSFSKYGTGTAICLITPDFERTMLVNLGSATHLDKNNINEQDIVDSEIIHFTGYQLDNPNMRSVSEYLVGIAKKNNIKVSLDIADVGVIERNYDFLKDFLKDVNILFANEEEAKAFTKKTEAIEALKYLANFCDTAIVKIGSKGSYISDKGKVIMINGVRVNAIDTIGAGDVYAGAILFGLTQSLTLEQSGNLASFTASEIVKISGGRFLEKINIQKYR
jgi:sugar/nucleoside kinase (ribokinase family)